MTAKTADASPVLSTFSISLLYGLGIPRPPFFSTCVHIFIYLLTTVFLCFLFCHNYMAACFGSELQKRKWRSMRHGVAIYTYLSQWRSYDCMRPLETWLLCEPQSLEPDAWLRYGPNQQIKQHTAIANRRRENDYCLPDLTQLTRNFNPFHTNSNTDLIFRILRCNSTVSIQNTPQSPWHISP